MKNISHACLSILTLFELARSHRVVVGRLRHVSTSAVVCRLLQWMNDRLIFVILPRKMDVCCV